MRKIFIYGLLSVLTGSCAKLDIDPSSSLSSRNFFSSQKELEIAVNDLYQPFLFKIDYDEWGDDHFIRGVLTNPVTNSTINSETDFVNTYWSDMYKGISWATTLLENMQKAKEVTSADVYNRIEGEARCLRAYCYAVLISHYGDVVFYGNSIPLEGAYTLERTDKNEILQYLYNEFDAAAEKLPSSYASGNLKRVTKGVALGLKARLALYMGDFNTAKTAAKAVMDLGVHHLYDNYRNLFLKAGENSSEIMLAVPHSIALGNPYTNTADTRNLISRNAGGFGARIPTWSAVDIYECTDGKTIDQSPLYDPHDPFANRDPRLSDNIVPFNADWLGYTYQPHPDSLKVYSSKHGNRVTNNDTRSVAQFASYTGFIWKKRVTQDWSDNLQSENASIVLRYADVLLMYAESKIELNEIDNTVLDAINSVRARAYGVAIGSPAYPKITTTDQSGLRSIVRRERRAELMLEGLRYMDLVRWKIANKALNVQVPGLMQPADQDRGQWPFTNTVLPTIDSNAIVMYEPVIAAGYARKLTDYTFDAGKQYLWPIPASERLLNDGLTQNQGY